MKVVLYSTDCPQCKVLKKKLDDKGIEYEVVSDVDEMLRLGFTSAPMLTVDDEIMNPQMAFLWLESVPVEECSTCKLN